VLERKKERKKEREKERKKERLSLQVQDYLYTSSECSGGLAPEITVFLVHIFSISAD